jgi:putative transposase
MVIHAGSVNRDHVHLLASIPPSLSVSRAVHLKGRSSHKLLSEFGILRKRYWGQHLWGRGYWVASSGKTDEVWVGVHQEPDAARTGRQLQCDVSPPNGGLIRL